MLHLIRSLALAALAVLAFHIQAEEANPARQASELEPTTSQQGTTANRGPMHYGSNGEKTEKAEKAEKSESTEKAEKHEDAVSEKEEKHEHKEACEDNGKSCKAGAECGPDQAANCDPGQTAGCGQCETPNADSEAKAAAEELKAERAKLEFDRKMRAAIRRLSSSGWREAQIELVGAGKGAIPYLIDALATKDEGEITPAYNLGGHVKADAGRAPRQRSVADVASELLTNIVTNHSTFKGELPTLDQKAWQEWWIVNGETVTFGK